MNRNRKITRVGKTVVSGLVVTSLVLGNGAFTNISYAKEVTKEESVYVNADADGNTEKITVSDWLKNAGINGTLTDKSDLQEIQNVKGEETFEQSGDDVSWNAGSDDIYYQGTTSKELPVGVSISYQLDGKDISAEELAGKSGKVEITVSYTNKSKVVKTVNGKKTEMYTPFLMATGVILPTDKFTNVEVTDGKIINEGSNNIVIGFGLPGMAKSLDVSDDIAEKFREKFTITADVTDFSLGNTITYASASILSDLEVDDEDSLDDLEDDIDTLVDSSEELVSGSKTLSESMSKLKDKFEDYSDGENELNDGIKTLEKSGKTLVNGVKEYTTGVDSLANGATDYVNGAKQITEGNQKLYDAVKDMPKSYQEFSTGISQYTAGVDTLGNKETGDALKKGAEAVSSGISTLNTNLNTLAASYDNYATLVAGIQAQAAQCTDEVQKQTLLAYAQKLKELSDTQKASVAALASATGKDSTLKSGADQLSAGIAKMVDGAQKLAASSSTLRDADKKMTSSIATLVSSIEKLKNGGEKLSKNDKKLLAGAKKILKAGKSMNSGSKKLISGVEKLKKGSNKLDKATGKVASGIKKLDDGADELYDGMKRFDKEGIQEINDMYQDDFKNIKERLSALLDVSKEYNNFSGISDNMDGEVKFIIETEEIGGDDEE